MTHYEASDLDRLLPTLRRVPPSEAFEAALLERLTAAAVVAPLRSPARRRWLSRLAFGVATLPLAAAAAAGVGWVDVASAPVAPGPSAPAAVTPAPIPSPVGRAGVVAPALPARATTGGPQLPARAATGSPPAPSGRVQAAVREPAPRTERHQVAAPHVPPMPVERVKLAIGAPRSGSGGAGSAPSVRASGPPALASAGHLEHAAAGTVVRERERVERRGDGARERRTRAGATP